MTTINATTYSGSTITLSERQYRKAVKACAMQGIKNPNTTSTSNEITVKYLRAKNAAFHHALHNANLYSMKIVGRNVFVI